MVMSAISMALSQQQVNTNYPKGCVGQKRFVECCKDSVKTGWHNNIGSVQITKVTFPDPKLKPGSEVYFNISSIGCSCTTITVKNCDKTDMDLTKMAASIGSQLIGFESIVNPQDPKSIIISGKPNEKFTIEATGFNSLSKGVETPAAPIISTVQDAGKMVKIGFGVAVVNNPVLHATNEAKSRPSIIASSSYDIVELPTHHPTEHFVGITIRNESGKMPQPYDCCNPEQDCGEYYDCHECIHYIGTCCTDQQVMVKLEKLDGIVNMPQTLVGLPIFYRHTPGDGYSYGSLSILGGNDPKRSIAKHMHTDNQWVIKEVVSSAHNTVYIGVE
jgi:hypothetical protein